MADVVSITLLRHGITKANQEKRYIGWSDVSLDRDLLPTVQLERKYEMIYTSDLKRCQETVQLLSPGQSYSVDKRLREMNFGSWEKHKYDQLKDDPLYCKWLTDPFATTPPKGESFLLFRNRVLTSFQEIIRTMMEHSQENVLIVSHGGPVRLIITTYTQMTKTWWEWDVPYFGGYSLSWDKKALEKGELQCISSSVVPFTVKKDG